MMKRTLSIFFITIFIAVTPVNNAVAAGLFHDEIRKAADKTIAAWLTGDNGALKKAAAELLRAESYMLATGEGEEKSYLMHVPPAINKKMSSVAAYVFLLQKKKEGVNLFPASLFEGERFMYKVKSVMK